VTHAPLADTNPFFPDRYRSSLKYVKLASAFVGVDLGEFVVSLVVGGFLAGGGACENKVGGLSRDTEFTCIMAV
jgi:hypothetical protein